MERSGLEWDRTNNILEDGMERNGLELYVIWFFNMKWIRMECNCNMFFEHEMEQHGL